MAFSHANQDEWSGICQVEGTRQSPIDIPKGSAPIKEFPKLSLKNQRKTTWSLENTGNFARVSIATEADQNILLSGGPLTGEYKFDHFQFHWGKGEGEGSEHSYDGTNFAGEIHYQFTLTGEPEDGQDKVAVICLNMREVTPQANRKTSMLAVQNSLEKCYEYQAKAEIDKIDFFRIINACFEESDYFTYKGSLTYPPCEENVTYIVYEKPGEFSSEMFNHFRQFKDANGNPIQSCHREKRAELGDREISRFKHPKIVKKKKPAEESPAVQAAPADPEEVEKPAEVEADSVAADESPEAAQNEGAAGEEGAVGENAAGEEGAATGEGAEGGEGAAGEEAAAGAEGATSEGSPGEGAAGEEHAASEDSPGEGAAGTEGAASEGSPGEGNAGEEGAATTEGAAEGEGAAGEEGGEGGE